MTSNHHDNDDDADVVVKSSSHSSSSLLLSSTITTNNNSNNNNNEPTCSNDHDPRTRTAHTKLVGRERLLAVVSKLGQSCPWTASVNGPMMIEWLQAELIELSQELSYYYYDEEEEEDYSSSSTMVTTSQKKKKKKQQRQCFGPLQSDDPLISELGDVIFDVLLLQYVLRRDFGFDAGDDAPWHVAALKVERRTPYMKEWGDGVSVAKTVEDTKRYWKAAKKQEKQQLAKIASKSSPRRNRRDHHHVEHINHKSSKDKSTRSSHVNNNKNNDNNGFDYKSLWLGGLVGFTAGIVVMSFVPNRRR